VKIAPHRALRRRLARGAAAVELTIGIAVVLLPLFTGSFVLVNAAHMKEWLQSATNVAVRDCALDPTVVSAPVCVRQKVQNRVTLEGFDGRCAQGVTVVGEIANQGDPNDPVSVLSASVTCQYEAPGWPGRLGAITIGANASMPRLY